MSLSRVLSLMFVLSATVLADSDSEDENVPPFTLNSGVCLRSSRVNTFSTLQNVPSIRAMNEQHNNNTAPLPMRRFIRSSSGRLTVLEMERVEDSFAPRITRVLQDRDENSYDTVLIAREESNSTDETVSIESSTATEGVIGEASSSSVSSVNNARPSTSRGEVDNEQPSTSNAGTDGAGSSTSVRTCTLCRPTSDVLNTRELYLRTLRHTVLPREDTEWQEQAALVSLRESRGRLLDEVWQIGQMINDTVPEDTQLRYAPAALESLLTSVGIVLDEAAERLDIAGQRFRRRVSSNNTITPNSPEPDVRAECIICYGFPTRFLRPCGHVLCNSCLDLVERCPQCKRGISHSFRLFL